jgi:hypothetical protein
MQEFKSVAPASASVATVTAADDSSAATAVAASAEPAAAPAKQQKLGQNEESKTQTEPGCFYCGLTSKQYTDR